jgi:glycosyltransferase involved in cell wall biosynthesis
VVSEGVGREYLSQLPELPNLRFFDFRPYGELPQVLAAADVLLATLEEDAGAFAVPSKVLTYLCAGRPVMLAAPGENLAAEIVRRSGGGVTVTPGDLSGWIKNARRLAEDSEWRTHLGRNAREYAEANFDIDKIAARFEGVLMEAAERGRHRARRTVAGAVSTAGRRRLWLPY